MKIMISFADFEYILENRVEFNLLSKFNRTKDPEVNSAGRLNRYFSWGEDTKPVERGMLIGIGLQLINSYIFFDESHKFSKNSLQKVDNIIGHLISTFPKKYSKWRKMSPEISRVSENLSEYSSKEEFISEIAWIFAGKLFKLKKTRV